MMMSTIGVVHNFAVIVEFDYDIAATKEDDDYTSQKPYVKLS